MNLLQATSLLVCLLCLLPKASEGQSCSFTTNFGNGNALTTSSVEGFNAAGGSTTTCTLSCNGGATTTLWIKYGGTPSIFDNDGSAFNAAGCSASVSISRLTDAFRLGYTVNSATYNELTLSCSCDNVGPAEPTTPGGGGVCFSETATVWTHRGTVPMKYLQVGDKVLVGHKNKKPIYEPVYSFGHIQESEEATFLRLYTNLTATGGPLEISESHMIYKLEEGQPVVVRADSIKVWDVVFHNSAAAQVNTIASVKKRGLYMPLTPSGSIVVNGVKASTYVSIQEWAPSVVQTLSRFGFSEQTVFHWWLAPYRFLCMGLSKQFCERGPSTSEEGILNYLLRGKQMAELAEGFGPIARVVLFGPPLTIFFGLFIVLEYPLGPSMAPFVLVVVLALFWLRFVKPTRQEEKWTKKTA